MSWKASAWAKDQRLGSPSAKSILMCLADYADPEGLIKGWASQSDLAEAAEVSERTAREWLQRLEEWGLVERQRQQRPSGARAADHIVLRLDRSVTDGAERCRRLKEREEEADLPAESAGRTNRQQDAEPTGNEAHPTGNQFRAYKDKPPIEPPLPSQPGAQARQREGDLEDRKKIEAAYWRMIRVWPGLHGMPKDTGLKAFMALTPEERDMAERRFPAWLEALKAQKKDHVHQPSTYFGKKLFADIADPTEAPPPPSEAPPLGKLWGAVRMRVLLAGAGPVPAARGFVAQLISQGGETGERERLAHISRYGFPVVNRMHDLAASGRSTMVRAGDEPPEEALALMVPCRVGSAAWLEWKDFHEAQGWPWLPDPGRQEWVYFPAGGPGGLGAFEQAVRGNHDAGGREAAE